jgi:hypothetical protein
MLEITATLAAGELKNALEHEDERVVFGAGKLAAFSIYCKEYLTKRLGLNLTVKLPYMRGTERHGDRA